MSLKQRAIALTSALLLVTNVMAAAKSVLNIQHWQTRNGASVYFVHAPEIAMVDVRVVFAAGSAYDGQHYGLSAFVNSLLAQGTATQSADQIAKDFDRVGAQFASDSDQDMAILSLRSLRDSRYLTPALNAFTDVLNHPSFPQKAIQRTKNIMLAALKVQQQSPGQIANQAMYKALYGNQPYAHDENGTSASVHSFSQAMAKRFYQRYYVAHNADVIIVGDVDRAQAARIAEQVVGRLPAGKVATQAIAKPVQHQQRDIHVNFPAQQTTIMLGQLGITRKNPDFYALIVGNHILGGMPMNSILFKEVRDQRGLAYFAYSYFTMLRDRGPYLVNLKTKASDTQRALSVVENALNNFVKNGPTAAQLAAAKRNLIGAFPLALASNKNILSNVTAIAFNHRPLNYLDTYRAKINAVTVAQVKHAMQRYIHPQRMVIVTVGPS